MYPDRVWTPKDDSPMTTRTTGTTKTRATAGRTPRKVVPTAAAKTAAKTATKSVLKSVPKSAPKTARMTTHVAAARRALEKADPVLGRHMQKVGAYALKLDETSDLYQALAEAIVYQQLHAKAAATIFGRLRALGASGFPSPAELLTFDDATLRGVGLSSAKTKAIRDLAARQHAGELPSIDEAHVLDDDVLVERLTAVRGIGPWTVEMLLIFRLGRTDVLPSTDYGIRQGFMKVFRTKELPTPAQVLARGERWRPYRTMASWYLWRALDS